MKTPFFRLVLFFIVLFLVFVLPWWLKAPLLFFLVIYFDFYIEVIFFGFLIDTLYLVDNGIFYPALTSSFVILIIASFVKTRIRT